MLVTHPETRHETADFELDPVVLDGLWRMEERHFWHAARNRWIARALDWYGLPPPARFLDVGCGSGAVASSLQRRGYEVVGIDTAEVLVRKAHERCPEATFVAAPIQALAHELGPFDGVGFFDVLEHLDEPLSLLQAAIAHARPGALVVATVPAQMALFSVVDALSGHKRRYETGELAGTFKAAGLVEVEERGMFRILSPLIRARRSASPGDKGDKGDKEVDPETRRRILLADTRVPAFPMNLMLEWACALELRVGFARAKNKIGPSLLVVGRTARPGE